MSEPEVIRERIWYDGTGRARVEREVRHEVEVVIPMSEIKPALTAEEWAEGETTRDESTSFANHKDYVGVYCGSEQITLLKSTECHAVAAFCLHEQPFGFTRTDVEKHRRCWTLTRDSIREIESTTELEELSDWHWSMADRIEALLPPEENHGSPPDQDRTRHIAQHTEEHP